jgi:hypothetical protein
VIGEEDRSFLDVREGILSQHMYMAGQACKGKLLRDIVRGWLAQMFGRGAGHERG